MQSRNRQAETSSTSCFNRDYLTAVDRHYGAWLLPTAHNDLGYVEGMPSPGSRLELNNWDLAKFGDFAYKISIINPDLMNFQTLIRNVTLELEDIILMRVTRRGEDHE